MSSDSLMSTVTSAARVIADTVVRGVPVHDVHDVFFGSAFLRHGNDNRTSKERIVFCVQMSTSGVHLKQLVYLSMQGCLIQGSI